MTTCKSERWCIDEFQLTNSLYSPDSRLEPHCDGRFRISVVVSGLVCERFRQTEEHASSLSVVTKPADARHSNRFGPRGARLVSVEVPAALLDGTVRRSSRLCCWRWHHGHAFKPAAALIRMVIDCRETPQPSADNITEQVDFLLDTLADIPAPVNRRPPAWLRVVRDHIHDTFDEQIPVAMLAKEAKVHPTHLTRWFRNFYGYPVTTYRQRLRLKAALEALAAGDKPLADVANAAGFCDQSHLTNALRRHTGMTPAAIRRLARRA